MKTVYMKFFNWGTITLESVVATVKFRPGSIIKPRPAKPDNF